MGAVELLAVELAYGARCQRLTVPYGTSVRGVIERARLLEQHPEIDLAVNRVGIYATLVALETQMFYMLGAFAVALLGAGRHGLNIGGKWN